MSTQIAIPGDSHSSGLSLGQDRPAGLPALTAVFEESNGGGCTHEVTASSGALFGLVGESPAMGLVLDRLARVAATSATVLVTGETGSGKELIARAIHAASPRARRPFVRVNCGALAEGLVASELFGHERGAFTGAVERRKGRFELANGGTIFLDEVGELPPAMQVALLRVLQEGELERVGGTETLKTDARVVTATNRNLDEAVREGRFRSDLLFRLNVVPIAVPALRERQGDIPLIADYYARLYARKVGKRIRGISSRAMEALLAHPPAGHRQVRLPPEEGQLDGKEVSTWTSSSKRGCSRPSRSCWPCASRLRKST
jgi:transcriptional regulator with GAF, ATPase, and Fis domain